MLSVGSVQRANAEAPPVPATSDASPAASGASSAPPPLTQEGREEKHSDGKGKSDSPLKSPTEPSLAALPKDDGPAPFAFRMGDRLKIVATGDPGGLEAELKKPTQARSFTLYLDGVPMVGLPFSVIRGSSASRVEVQFSLVRDSNVDGSRKAWDTYLSQQSHYESKPAVSLAIGAGLPQPVDLDARFSFSVASITRIRAVLWVGILIFVGLYILLVRQSQMAFWGLLVPVAFLGVWMVTGTMERIPEQILILLGISAGTGLGAILIEESVGVGADKTKGADETKKDRKGTFRAFLSDISDDGNGPSFHRLQVVIWTLILGAVFIRQVARTLSMPEFPETLLILMGISGVTYLGFKFPGK
jgi:hypothetical protein